MDVAMGAENPHETDEKGGSSFGAGNDEGHHVEVKLGWREGLSGVLVALIVVNYVFMVRLFVGKTWFNVS